MSNRKGKQKIEKENKTTKPLGLQRDFVRYKYKRIKNAGFERSYVFFLANTVVRSSPCIYILDFKHDPFSNRKIAKTPTDYPTETSLPIIMVSLQTNVNCAKESYYTQAIVVYYRLALFSFFAFSIPNPSGFDTLCSLG